MIFRKQNFHKSHATPTKPRKTIQKNHRQIACTYYAKHCGKNATTEWNICKCESSNNAVALLLATVRLIRGRKQHKLCACEWLGTYNMSHWFGWRHPISCESSTPGALVLALVSHTFCDSWGILSLKARQLIINDYSFFVHVSCLWRKLRRFPYGTRLPSCSEVYSLYLPIRFALIFRFCMFKCSSATAMFYVY